MSSKKLVYLIIAATLIIAGLILVNWRSSPSDRPANTYSQDISKSITISPATPSPKITPGPAEILSITPTSGSIAFIKDEIGEITDTGFQVLDRGIYYIKADGTGFKKAVNFPPKYAVLATGLNFSDSGKYLFWTRESNLEITKIDGSQKQPTQFNFAKFGKVLGGVSISADDTKIALITRPEITYRTKGNIDINLTILDLNNPDSRMDTKIGSLTDLSGSDLDDSPIWITSSQLILYSKENNQFKLSIYEISNDIKKSLDISESESPFSASLNPLKNQLYYIKHQTVTGQQDEIWLYDLNTKTNQKLESFALDKGWYISSVSFSPDNTKMATQSHSGDSSKTNVYDLNSSKLISTWYNFLGLSWLGDSIVGTTDYNSSNIGVANILTGKITKIARQKDQFIHYSSPVWYPK